MHDAAAAPRMLSLVVAAWLGHVRLVYPPAASPSDFLDAARSPGPCGVAGALLGNATVLRQLTATADAQMKLPAVVAGISVTDKPVLPPSGDSHDYYSIAAYLWPCTAKCNVRSPAQ